MKKVKFFGLAGIILLASGAGFSSCSSDSADPTGGTGVAGQVVKTQFAINIPYGNNSSTNQAKKVTRMTADMTQQNNHFRGISDIVLLTFDGDPASKGTINADKPIYISADGNAYEKDPNRRLYRDIEIPVGTNRMLFYGKASKNTESKFEAGYITEKADKKTEKTLTNISHELTPINSAADFTTDEDAKAIIKALNDIANAQVTDGSATYTWATIGSEPTLPSWLTKHEQEFLKDRYNAFITLTAGSKTSVKACIESLKAALAGETPGADVPAAKQLTAEIYKKCKDALDNTINGLGDFPGKFNLPDGAAALSWTSGGFAYSVPGNANFVTRNTIDYQKICYPAELSYFVNTTTMVSDKDMSSLNDFPLYDDWTKNTGADWSAKTNFSEGAVKNSTKTVGLKDPVQYSVAVLKSTVKCDAATLQDNGQSKGGLKADQSITVTDNSFPVTGILIGGQPASVNWKYEPASTETFAYTIYDNVMNGGTMYAKHETNASNANYTLVFDNNSTDKKPVFVTIELKNNSGMDFYGNDGIILNGAKFYLVGKLNPDATEGVNNTGNFNRVFVQDYITKANFNIKNLKGAYNCIPDLRTSGINVGLAVDLSWQEGITFNVDL